MRKQVLMLRRGDGVDREAFAGHLRDAVRRAGVIDAVIDLAVPANASPADAVVSWQSDAPDAFRTVADPAAGFAQIVGGYEVDEIVHWDDAPGAPPGHTMVACSCRLPGLTREQFIERYRAHAAVARVHHPAIRRYVQWFVTATLAGSRECEAIALLHFGSADDFADRLYRDERSCQVIADDVAGFMDRRRVWVFFTTDRIVVRCLTRARS